MKKSPTKQAYSPAQIKAMEMKNPRGGMLPAKGAKAPAKPAKAAKSGKSGKAC